MGRLGSEGRERRMMAAGFICIAAAFPLLLLSGWAALLVSMVLFGAAAGPIDVALFSLRQRRTAPAWFGRAFAVSMALNFAGMPLGSALAGPLVARSTVLAVGVAGVLGLVSAVLCAVMIPRSAD
jgi:predicted MFS family arabinose efflux permease